MIIIDIDKKGQNGTTIFNILDNTTELWMTKYIIGEIFSSGGATLYKNPSDQTVFLVRTTAFPCANTCNKRKSVSLKDATSIKEVVTFGEVWAPPPHSTHTLKRTLMFTQTQK